MVELNCVALPAMCILAAAAGPETDSALVAPLCLGRTASYAGGDLLSDLRSLITSTVIWGFFCDLWFVKEKSLL